MKNIFSFLILLLASIALSAQCDPGGGGVPSVSGGGGGVGSLQAGGASGLSINSSFGQQFLSGIYSGSYAKNNALAYQEIQGNPYLNEEEVKGTLVMNDGNIIKDVLLMVDLYTHEIIATVDGEQIVLDGRFFREIIVPHNGNDLVFQKTNPKKPEQFYEVLFQSGDMVFFKDRSVTLREASNSGLAKVDARFNYRTKYFIKHGEGEVAKVKLKKKDIFSGFMNSEVYAMKEYAKDKGIKFKDESDYVAVFEATQSSEND